MTTVKEREHIGRLAAKGFTSQEISQLLDIKTSTVKKWRTRLKKGNRWKAKWVDLLKVP